MHLFPNIQVHRDLTWSLGDWTRHWLVSLSLGQFSCSDMCWGCQSYSIWGFVLQHPWGPPCQGCRYLPEHRLKARLRHLLLGNPPPSPLPFALPSPLSSPNANLHSLMRQKNSFHLTKPWLPSWHWKRGKHLSFVHSKKQELFIFPSDIPSPCTWLCSLHHSPASPSHPHPHGDGGQGGDRCWCSLKRLRSWEEKWTGRQFVFTQVT